MDATHTTESENLIRTEDKRRLGKQKRRAVGCWITRFGQLQGCIFGKGNQQSIFMSST